MRYDALRAILPCNTYGATNMAVKIDITTVTYEEAHSENGCGHWGVKLGPNEIIAYQCPMLGDGGASSENQNVLAWILSSYVETDNLDPADGPDEVLFIEGDSYFLATISVE